MTRRTVELPQPKTAQGLPETQDVAVRDQRASAWQDGTSIFIAAALRI
jgi:hypothetical protein